MLIFEQRLFPLELLSGIDEQILLLQSRKRDGDHLRSRGRWLNPLPARLRGPVCTQGLQLALQRLQNEITLDNGKKLRTGSQASAERSGAIAIEESRSVRKPAGFADCRITGVRLEEEVQTKSIGLTDHRQPVMGNPALQGEHSPGGLRRSSTTRQQDCQGRKTCRSLLHPAHQRLTSRGRILIQDQGNCRRRAGRMVLTPSTMLPLGHPLPAFRLPVVSGQLAQPVPGTPTPMSDLGHDDLPNQPVLVMLICAHCPFVKHVEPELSRLESDYGQRVSLLAVSSNSVISHPQDGPQGLRQQAEHLGWTFPYLFDEQQSLAKDLRGACTPEFYLFAPDSSAQQTLRYRGQLDGSRPGSAAALDGHDLRQAMDAVLAGQPVRDQQTPSIGCNIKWHPGQEPPWFGSPA